MKKPAFILLLLLAAVPLSRTIAQKDIKGYTEDGRRVILKEDGTWMFAPVKESVVEETDGGVFLKPDGATKVLEGSQAGYEIWYDPSVWTYFTQASADGEYSFKLNRGEAYAMVVAQRMEVSLDDLKISVLENARQASPDWHIVKSEKRTINGKELSMMEMEGPFKGIAYVYLGYYYSGPEGTIQFFAYTQKALFDQFRKDIEDLLNGLIISL